VTHCQSQEIMLIFVLLPRHVRECPDPRRNPGEGRLGLVVTIVSSGAFDFY